MIVRPAEGNFGHVVILWQYNLTSLLLWLIKIWPPNADPAFDYFEVLKPNKNIGHPWSYVYFKNSNENSQIGHHYH